MIGLGRAIHLNASSLHSRVWKHLATAERWEEGGCSKRVHGAGNRRAVAIHLHPVWDIALITESSSAHFRWFLTYAAFMTLAAARTRPAPASEQG